jgi:hypothetical protein
MDLHTLQKATDLLRRVNPHVDVLLPSGKQAPQCSKEECLRLLQSASGLQIEIPSSVDTEPDEYAVLAAALSKSPNGGKALGKAFTARKCRSFVHNQGKHKRFKAALQRVLYVASPYGGASAFFFEDPNANRQEEHSHGQFENGSCKRRCAVCKIRKKGKCGTETASSRCLVRRDLQNSNRKAILEM